MIDWYLATKNLLRAITSKARDVLAFIEDQAEHEATAIQGYMQSDYQQLWDRWRSAHPGEDLGSLGRHIAWGQAKDYKDIIERDVPLLERRADEHLAKSKGVTREGNFGFEALLHPVIRDNSYQHFRTGNLREAVLNSITALFDFIRERSHSDLDGETLVNEAFSLESPVLIFSELRTTSGKNDQKGFMQILRGVYQGVRNPKAHSLIHDLTEEKAAQYLVFASLLARRIEEAKLAG